MEPDHRRNCVNGLAKMTNTWREMYLIINLNIILNMGTSADGPDRSWPGSDLQRIIDSTPALIHTARPDGYHDFFNETWLNYVGCLETRYSQLGVHF
jgi:hypothetical protein